MDHPDYYDGPPIGAHRYPGPEDPALDFTQRLTIDDIHALDGEIVRVTMTARDDIDPDHRIYDNVKIQAAPLGTGPQFMIRLTQLLIPSTEWGFAAMAAEPDDLQFGHSLISVTPTDRLYPVRRTYTPTELNRWAGLGGLLTIIRAAPDRPIETGVVHRPVTIDAVEGDTVHLSHVLATAPNEYGSHVPTRKRPFQRSVPIGEVAFAMQQPLDH